MEFKFIIKKLNKTLTPEEEKIFDNWLHQSQSHKDYFEKVKSSFQREAIKVDVDKGWADLENRMQNIHNTAINFTQRKISFWKYAVAASMALILGISGYLISTGILSKQSKIVVTASKKTVGKTNSVTLTLEDGAKIMLGQGRTFHFNNMFSNGERVIYKGYYIAPKEIGYNVLTVPRGVQFTLILSDGTKIWLNSDTKIKYPNEFVEGRLRKVELLYGEAFFVVSPSTLHKGSAFQVTIREQKVEVLGTEFNIKAYRDSKSIFTTLIKGVVRIDYGSSKKILKPKYQAVVQPSNNEIFIRPVNVFNVTAWKKGYFSFDKTSLFEITRVLSRWYDVRFIFLNQDVGNVKYTGILDRKLNIETILSILKKTNDVDYEVKGNIIYIKKR